MKSDDDFVCDSDVSMSSEPESGSVEDDLDCTMDATSEHRGSTFEEEGGPNQPIVLSSEPSSTGTPPPSRLLSVISS
jgi:hypothetical protein